MRAGTLASGVARPDFDIRASKYKVIFFLSGRATLENHPWTRLGTLVAESKTLFSKSPLQQRGRKETKKQAGKAKANNTCRTPSMWYLLVVLIPVLFGVESSCRLNQNICLATASVAFCYYPSTPELLSAELTWSAPSSLSPQITQGKPIYPGPESRLELELGKVNRESNQESEAENDTERETEAESKGGSRSKKETPQRPWLTSRAKSHSHWSAGSTHQLSSGKGTLPSEPSHLRAAPNSDAPTDRGRGGGGSQGCRCSPPVQKSKKE